MARVFKKPNSPFWYGDYEKGGRRVRESLKTTSKRDAQAELKRRVNAVFDKRLDYVTKRARAAGKDNTVGAVARRHVERRKLDASITAKTMARSEYIAMKSLARFHHVTFRQLKASDVELWIYERLQERSHDTVSKELQELKAIIRLAIMDDIIDSHKVLLLKVPGKPADADAERVALERDEFERLLSVCNEKYKAIFTLLVYSGMRKGELAKLTYDMVNGTYIHLPANITKSSRARRIPLHPKARAAIETLRAYSDGEHVAPRASERTWLMYLKDRLPEAGIDKNVVVHSLRHTAATWLANTPGVPLQSVRNILGHKSLELTSRYVHADPSADDKAMTLLD